MKQIQVKRFFSGLSGELLLWFLLIALMPLCITSWVNYQDAKDHILADTTEHLIDISLLQTTDIHEEFDERMVNLEAETNRKSTNLMMSLLSRDLQYSGRSVKEFVRGFSWAKLVETYAHDLKNYQYNDGHYNVLLIDTQGNVLYSGFRGENLGENLFTGDLSETRFATATRAALDSGKIIFSDLELYGSPRQLSGFLVSPLLGLEKGDKIGAIAVQLAGHKLLNLIDDGTDFGETGKRYLIGPDLTLRTPGALGKAYPVLERKVETNITREYYQDHVLQNNPASSEGVAEQVSVYDGPNGERVLGMHTIVDIAGVGWAYIAEVNVDEAYETSQDLALLTLEMVGTMFLVLVVVAFLLARSIVKPVENMSAALVRVGDGDFSKPLPESGKHELRDLAIGFNSMIEKLRQSDKKNTIENWLQLGAKNLSTEMQGDQDLAGLAETIISFLCRYLDAQIGVFYVVDDKKIKLMGSYAFNARKGFRNEFAFGEGMVGQAALEKQCLTLSDIPEDYLAVSSGLGESAPGNIVIIPVEWNGEVIALLEFGVRKEFDSGHLRLLEMVSASIATSVQTAVARDQAKELLATTQTQAEELRVSEEELKESNETLERQALELKKSQAELEERNEKLQLQQEELRVANEELEERAGELKDSRVALETKNLSLESARQELERKAKELEISTKYKSEFLANMSHELRTPLNSLLILAGILAENKEDNLTEQQVSYSKTIYDSGSDLLNLLNEILDLAKIESGKLEVIAEPIQLDDFTAELQQKFNPLAENKGIDFVIAASEAPTQWVSDSQKLKQIIKNFLSNAFKFTSEGSVTLQVGPVPDGIRLNSTELANEDLLAFSVIDTGIGIPVDKQQIIFEAFQQADGTTSREYGGTGLGLSISRELARALGGEVHVQSEDGKGSSFTLIIPLKSEKQKQKPEQDRNLKTNPAENEQKPVSHSTRKAERSAVTSEANDDRGMLKPGDRSILIVEDDEKFASIVADIARSQDFKVLIAGDGRTGLHLADYYQPSGIILDIGLPDIDGWQVMDYLKDSSKTRHIPVHFMSASDKSPDAMRNGAIGFTTKPTNKDEISGVLSSINDIVDRPVKKLLLVDDDDIQIDSLRDLIGNGDVETIPAKTGQAALDLMNKDLFDCIVLDYNLPDMSGLEVLEKLRSIERLQHIPVIVYTNRDLDPEEKATLDRLAQSVIIKDGRSPERILDDTSLFLHRLEANLPDKQRKMISMLHDSETLFENRKVLLVDDDMRNIFSLSAVLQQKNMVILTAKNGVEALEVLEDNPDTAIVLMDIMMPVMDGYEAMRKIREREQFAELPIIALTAKAMKGDRALCIESGANDYLSKPIDTEKLLSVMRVWLYR